jgi:hypothetical protein
MMDTSHATKLIAAALLLIEGQLLEIACYCENAAGLDFIIHREIGLLLCLLKPIVDDVRKDTSAKLQAQYEDALPALLVTFESLLKPSLAGVSRCVRPLSISRFTHIYFFQCVPPEHFVLGANSSSWVVEMQKIGVGPFSNL